MVEGSKRRVCLFFCVPFFYPPKSKRLPGAKLEWLASKLPHPQDASKGEEKNWHYSSKSNGSGWHPPPPSKLLRDALNPPEISHGYHPYIHMWFTEGLKLHSIIPIYLINSFRWLFDSGNMIWINKTPILHRSGGVLVKEAQNRAVALWDKVASSLPPFVQGNVDLYKRVGRFQGLCCQVKGEGRIELARLTLASGEKNIHSD